MSDVITVQGFTGKEWRPIDEIRLELTARAFCIHLYIVLVRELTEQTEVLTATKKGLEWLHSATDQQVADATAEMMASSEVLLDSFRRFAVPKVSWQRLADDYQWLLRERRDLPEKGIPVGWIAQRFQMPAFALNEHQPWHGRVGIGRNANYTSYDEMHLLSDMAYFLAVARATLVQLDKAKGNNDRLRGNAELYETITGVKSNICACARQSVVAGCAFVESFVNGLGIDHLERNLALPTKQKQFLSGRENGRWVSLDRRLEGFPQVIRGVSKPFYRVCDRDRRDEPFKSFFETAVDVRDGAMHAGKGKATIWLGPYEWVDLAARATDSALKVGQVLWSHCKPNAPMPKWLWEMDPVQLKEHAENRVRAAVRLGGLLQAVGMPSSASGD